MAVAGMVINSDRENVVDFTKPYMNYGVGILLRKPQKKSNVFAFLEPLDIKVNNSWNHRTSLIIAV